MTAPHAPVSGSGGSTNPAAWLSWRCCGADDLRSSRSALAPVQIGSMKHVTLLMRPASRCSVALLALAVVAADAQKVQRATIEVVGITPVDGTGIERDKYPANVQRFAPQHAPEQALTRGAAGVESNDPQGNALAPDLHVRGFAVSPLLGSSETLAVFQDGVRLNEPFGDTVIWAMFTARRSFRRSVRGRRVESSKRRRGRDLRRRRRPLAVDPALHRQSGSRNRAHATHPPRPRRPLRRASVRPRAMKPTSLRHSTPTRSRTSRRPARSPDASRSLARSRMPPMRAIRRSVCSERPTLFSAMPTKTNRSSSPRLRRGRYRFRSMSSSDAERKLAMRSNTRGEIRSFFASHARGV